MASNLKMKFLVSLLALAFFGTASAQVFSLGKCDANIQGVTNIDLPKYSGKWFLVKQSSSSKQTETKCSHTLISIINDSELQMAGEMHLKETGTEPIKETWTVKPDDSQSGKWILTPGFIADSMPLWILDTDYENYSLSYSCLDSYKGKLEYVWLDSRTKGVEADVLPKVEKILKEKKINLSLVDEVHDCDSYYKNSM